MHIEIDEVQLKELRHLLERRLDEMSSMIHHSDNTQVRHDLREERETVRSLLGLLEPAAA